MKIKKLLVVLLALPILAGLFLGTATAAERTREEILKDLTVAQSDHEKAQEKYEICKESWMIELRYEVNETLEEWCRESKKEIKKLADEIIILKRDLNSIKVVETKKILKIGNQTPFDDAGSLLGRVIDLLVKLVGTAALVFLVIGGFRMVVAGGNDNEIQKAKTMVQYAVIGLIVVLLAYIIVVFAQGILYR